MVFPVVGGDGKPTGYEIDNSLRLNDGDNPKLSITPASAGNRRTFSISFWQKKADVDNNNDSIIGVQGSDDATNFEVVNHSTQAFQIGLYHVNVIRTNRLFRDPSAWNHYFFFFDTTQASESNRFQLYIDGVQETSFSQTNIPSQNADLGMGRDTLTNFFNNHGTSAAIDAYIADFHYIDGVKKAHTDFGEFNDNGVWIPKEYEGAYGTNGIHLEFKETGTSANASGIGADTSGNDNHLTVTNLAATDVTVDTPTNNFATLNPVSNFHCGATYAEGNTRFISDESKYGFNCSSIGVANGKWYAEFKPISKDGEAGNWYMVGIAEGEQTGHRLVLGRDTGRTTSTRNGGIGWVGYGTNFVYQNDNYYDGDSNAYSTDAYTEDDILGIALNADDNEVTLYKNGTVQNSGTAFVLGTSETGLWHFGCGHFDTGNTFTIDANFGQPSYSNSSGNADANGYGDFEYAPPSGYYALCTKNLAEYG